MVPKLEPSLRRLVRVVAVKGTSVVVHHVLCSNSWSSVMGIEKNTEEPVWQTLYHKEKTAEGVLKTE